MTEEQLKPAPEVEPTASGDTSAEAKPQGHDDTEASPKHLDDQGTTDPTAASAPDENDSSSPTGENFKHPSLTGESEPGKDPHGSELKGDGSHYPPSEPGDIAGTEAIVVPTANTALESPAATQLELADVEEGADQEYVYLHHLDKRRQVDVSGGPYLDDMQRRQAEIVRAGVEGREPDLDNPPPTVGTPVVKSHIAAGYVDATNKVPVGLVATSDAPVEDEEKTEE